MTSQNLPTIGWIGAGRMGAQLIQRLLTAGYGVAVYNPDGRLDAAFGNGGKLWTSTEPGTATG